jgi:hypothetical protein
MLLVALRIKLRPFVAWLEGIGIEVVRGIETAAQITVLVPSPAGCLVLFDQRERYVGLLNLNHGQQPQHASTHYDNMGKAANLSCGDSPSQGKPFGSEPSNANSSRIIAA